MLDAILVVLGKDNKPDSHKLQWREQLNTKELIDAASKTTPAILFVLDILEKDSVPLIEKPLGERKRILAEVVTRSHLICPILSTIKGKELWEKIQEESENNGAIEGIIAKELSSRYEQGRRSWAWLRINNINTINGIIAGFTRGSSKGAFGSLVLASYAPDKASPLCIGQVREGIDAQTTKKLKKLFKQLKTDESFLPKSEKSKVEGDVIWLRPELIAKVSFLELTKEKVLREPRFIRLRFDKAPENCVLGV